MASQGKWDYMLIGIVKYTYIYSYVHRDNYIYVYMWIKIKAYTLIMPEIVYHIKKFYPQNKCK